MSSGLFEPSPLKESCNPGPHKRIRLPGFWSGRIPLDDQSTLICGKIHRSLEHTDRDALVAPILSHKKAAHRPDSQIVQRGQDPGARQSRVFFPGGNGTPRDRIQSMIKENSWRRGPNHLVKPCLVYRAFSFDKILARKSPGHAPTASTCPPGPEKGLQIFPSIRGQRLPGKRLRFHPDYSIGLRARLRYFNRIPLCTMVLVESAQGFYVPQFTNGVRQPALPKTSFELDARSCLRSLFKKWFEGGSFYQSF